ncbi:MAG: hypothetical protein V2J62_10575 [candidate division KSB1 bacterium]|nr:hypothetical protein [candidate division KSB1 bacterium]
MEPAHMKEILEARDRRAAGLTVPATGLCLVRVQYQALSVVSNVDAKPDTGE